MANVSSASGLNPPTDRWEGAGLCQHGQQQRVTRRTVGLKELAWMFDMDVRHARRLQNQGRQISPVRRKGSVRILGYSPEEIARFAALRFAKRRTFNRDAAARLGWLDFLEAIEREVADQAMLKNPPRFAEVRMLMRVELLVFGEDSPLAVKMGLTPLEVKHEIMAARDVLRDLLTESPEITAAIAAQIQAGLIAVGTKRGREAAGAVKHLESSVATEAKAGGPSGPPAFTTNINQRPRSQPARATGG